MGPFTKPFRASILAHAPVLSKTLVRSRRGSASGSTRSWVRGSTRSCSASRNWLRACACSRSTSPARRNRRYGSLVESGLGIPPCLRLVPVDFEAGDAWWERLAAAGFDARQPAVFASTGVSMYLTHEAIATTLRQVATLAAGTTLVMSFMLPIERVDPAIRVGVERAAAGARASGTPFLSFFMPEEMLALARAAGFRQVRHVSAEALADRYFAGRTDGLRPPRDSEELLVATA